MTRDLGRDGLGATDSIRGSDEPYLLTTAIEQAPAAAALFDSQLRYVVTTRRWAELSGFVAAAAPGRLMTDLPVLTPRLEQLVREVLDTGRRRKGVPISTSRTAERRAGGRPASLGLYPVVSREGQVEGVSVYLAAGPSPSRDLEVLQRSLLPSLPTLPGVELCSRYLPATRDAELGGDWYDVLPLPRAAVGLVVGDVVGHDLIAAAVMAQLRAALHSYASEGYGPAAVLRKLNDFVQTLPDEPFATVFFARMRLPGVASTPDPKLPVVNTGLMRYANAGHVPPLLITPGGAAHYLTGAVAPPVGVVTEDLLDAPDQADVAAPAGEEHVRLESGSTLLLYTDGLVERRTDSLAAGLDRLRRAATKAAHFELSPMCDSITTDLLGSRSREDDVALLAVRLPNSDRA